MEQQLVILSFLPAASVRQQFHCAALKLVKGKYPRIISFSGEDESGCSRIDQKKQLIDFCNGSVIAVFANETISLLNRYLGQEPEFKDIFEIKQLASIFFPTVGRRSPAEFSVALGIKNRGKTRSPALAEVRLSLGLLNLCWEKALKMDLGFLNRLAEYAKGLGLEVFFQYLIKEIVRQFPDRPINTGLNFQDPKINLFEEGGDQEDAIPDSPEWVLACFKSGGLLSRQLPGYEDRSIQKVMAKSILQGFSKAKNVLIEAGTGTGKTIAYLIPAMWWAKRNKIKVVVATHTITLQEQLFLKDLPLLGKIMPFQVKSALLKGRGNYLCLRTFYQMQPEDAFPNPDRIIQAQVFSWLRETRTGDFGELPLVDGLGTITKLYGADNPDCQPENCRFAKNCFMLKARKEAERADIIVINHSLLLADIKTNYHILPEHSHLIIDEAHNIYQTALKQLGFELSQDKISRLAESLSQGRRSLIYQFRKERDILLEVLPALNWQNFFQDLESLGPACAAILGQAKELFQLCGSILDGRRTLLLNQEKLGRELYTAFTLSVENLIVRLASLLELLNKLSSFLAVDHGRLDGLSFKLAMYKSETLLLENGLKAIVSGGQENRVTYLEKNHLLYLKNIYIDIAEILKEKIFSKNECTVLTSATLSVVNSFDYLARDLGIESYDGLRLDSPFNYNQQMLFCIVNDTPVTGLTEDLPAFKTADFIRRTAIKSNGRILVLFTSHQFLRSVYPLLLETGIEKDLNILAQGVNGNRDVLLREFINQKNSILLGTNSFWEGIDIPGNGLKCVIMVKLPFSPPDTPLNEAKGRLLQDRGQDPFWELLLPEAIIRFKQGFGRLIRTKRDTGTIILLDDRIIKKNYGKYFLKSLPVLSYYQGSSEEVLNKISDWL